MSAYLSMWDFAQFFTKKKLLDYAYDIRKSDDIPVPPGAHCIFPKKLNPLNRFEVVDEDDISQILLSVPIEGFPNIQRIFTEFSSFGGLL